MTFRKPVRKDFPEGLTGKHAYETFMDSDGCDDGKPRGWSSCFFGDDTPCNLYGTEKCYHGQGVKK